MYDYTIYSGAKHDLEQICSDDRHNDANNTMTQL